MATGSGGGWQQVFVVASVLNFAAAALALAALKPLRARMRDSSAVAAGTARLSRT